MIIDPAPTLLGALLLLVVTLYRFRPHIRRWFGWRKPGQRRRERKARRNLATLATIPEPGRKFAYLRKIDPFTFEEMILEALEIRGHKVKRNHRYTGDGGIDGRAWLNGELYLIQAKRYSGHITPAHVREFSHLVNNHGCQGLFVHTGKTGDASRTLTNADPNISIISGQRLLDLLAYPEMVGERQSRA